MATGGDGVARAGKPAVGACAAQLGSSNAGSHAYIRYGLPTSARSMVVGADLNVWQEGPAGSNVPLLRLFDSSGNRMLSVYRQNKDRDRVYVHTTDSYYSTTGKLALGAGQRLTVSVTVNGGDTSTVTVQLGSKTIYRTTVANLGDRWVRTVQFGNDVQSQAFALTVDNVTVS